MVSPLVELKPEKSKWEAFRFGIFWNRIPAAQGSHRLCLAMHSPGVGRVMGRRPTRIPWQVLFCEPSLAMVRRGAAGDGWLGVKKAILYYGTILDVSMEPALRMAGARPRFVRYLTYAAGLLR